MKQNLNKDATLLSQLASVLREIAKERPAISKVLNQMAVSYDARALQPSLVRVSSRSRRRPYN